MEGRAERREPVLAQVVVTPTPARLRESLERVDSMLDGVETDVRRRVRLLLGEIIGRSSSPEAEPSAPIQIDVAILPSTVRIEVSGDGLLMPDTTGGGGSSTRPSYPHWVLHELSDRWGSDRRTDGFGMWFLLARPDR
jgi:hypothetical protein